MSYKYRYTGSGIMTFHVDEKPYTVTVENREVTFDKKIEVAGMELIEEEKVKKTKETKK